MKTHSKLGLLMAGTALAISGGAEASGYTHSHCCKVKKHKPHATKHHHKIRHHTCQLRRACHHGHHHPKPRVRPVHKPTTVHYQQRPCRTHKPCAFKPLRMKVHPKAHPAKPCPSDWYNKLADLA